MNQTPSCLRGSLPVSRAHEEGFKWGAGGLSRDTNPYSPFGSERRLCAAWDEGWRDGWDHLNKETRRCGGDRPDRQGDA